MTDTPLPGERDPAYAAAQFDFIADWLDAEEPWPADGYLVVPMPPRLAFETDVERHECRILRRTLLWAKAPYVGRPFVYSWWAAIDDLGRAVAGREVTLQYQEWPEEEEPQQQRAVYCGEPELVALIGDVECCSSCHEDFDGGYYSELEVELPNGRWALVCCYVSSALSARSES